MAASKKKKSEVDDLLLEAAESEKSVDEELDSDKIIGVTAMVNKSRELQQLIASKEQELADAKEKLRVLLQVEIPESMDDMGVAHIKTTTGLTVTIKSDLKANISKENQSAAFAWLEKNGFADIIKGEVVVPFDRGQIKEKRALCEKLRKQGLQPVDRENIHWQTLRAFVKEQIEQGTNVPMDVFGVYQFREAVIKN